jgi:dTMP kinase
MTNNYKGTLVAVEGIDGAGTTTAIEKLKDRIGTDGIVYTQEPSDGVYGQFVRERLSDDETSPSDFFAFLADRYDHCENVIKPALEDGKVVITDRYDLSTYAYQSKVVDEQLGVIDPVKYIDEMTYHFTIYADQYYYIDVSVDTAMERIDGDEKYEVRERLEEAKRVYDGLCDRNENIHRVNGRWSPEEIAEKIHWNIESEL